ncbi:cation:proton antiporter [Nonomuraea guangzhouensis]|uniref:Cation:proton antiporter n=1 Tax=Nonomuraea guangzhouensis TaxID=1291555 RepID=A0ABW4FZB2_9ACTN|nr:cation:proton antiporter [Nonomuraea guangzhouensis]
MTLLAGPMAPIPGHQLLVFLVQIFLLLGAGLLLGRLAIRLRMPAIAGELCAGVLLGPSVLGWALPGPASWIFPAVPEQTHLVDAVGQIGVLLLVGIAGMNIDLALIRKKGVAAAWVSVGGLLVPLGLGIATGYALPAALVAQGSDRTVFAWFLGVALCVSAIPVIAKTLMELRLMHRDVGQLIISAAAVDDVVGWLLLAVVSAMATTGVRTGNVALAVAYLLLAVLFAATAGRYLVNSALRAAARSPERGVTVAVVSVVLIASAAGTQALGMEGVAGTLFAGILIGSSGWVDRERIAPLRTLVVSVLAPIFFAAAGLRMDLTALAQPSILLAAVGVVAVAVAGKFAGVYLTSRIARLDHWTALALGAGLNARGVIEVIIAMTGLRLGVLNSAMYTIVILTALATSLMAPPMLRYAVRHIAITTQEKQRERLIVPG